jgi:hypothetical protein
MLPRLRQRLLNEIVCPIALSGQRDRKSAEAWNRIQQFVAKGHWFAPAYIAAN